MAELVVGPFISFVVERLGNLLIQEERFLHGAQVDQMQRELSRMQCFLKAADARREEGEELVRNCISEIRELSLDAEDVIATFVVKVALMRRGRIHPMLKMYFRIINESRARYTVGLEIKYINKKINDLTRSLQTYGIQPTIALGESSTSRTERVQQLRRSYPHVVEEDIICLDEDVNAVVDHLVNEMINCRVISIWGMGGLGKTTLAKMVYNHIDVRHHFDCFAWAYISQQCKTREVLEEILIQLTSPELEGREKIRRMMHGELVGELYQAQSRRKCLVILDDIWDVVTWNSLSPAFPHEKASSKILLTTRIREVASFADEQCLHELRHLTEPESWELFQKKTCLKSDVTEFRLSTEMTVLGEKMVKHCGGLPLAIVVLGGLLATKRTLGEWEMVSRNVDYLMKGKGQGGVPVKIVLELSYNDLPYHLKACFLCLSDLPEDEDIRPIKLIQRWMAEGFVSLPVRARVGEVEDLTMLDIGMSYLDELRYRCMIQVGQLTRYSGRVKLYLLHDLVRDLCLLKAKEENFVEVVLMGEDSATTSSSASSSITIRRLGVYCKANRNVGDNRRRGTVKALRIDETCNLHHVRSCQLYSFGNTLEDSDWRHVKSIFKGFKLLTFLDLEKTKFHGTKYKDFELLKGKKLPKAIGNLIHLRYLSIRDSEITSLPSAIGNLQFLETLDLRYAMHKYGGKITKIPNVLWRLEQLRHLYLPGWGPWGICCVPSWVKLRLDGLSKLETLHGFHSETCDVRSFSTLMNLRKLEIIVYDLKHLAVILESPSFSNSNGLVRYSTFFIYGSYQTREEESLLRQVFGYRHLHRLFFTGSLTELPDALSPNLTRLRLRSKKPGLKEDPMPTLEKLPNLRRLDLEGGEWKKMVCSAGGFPQLIFLELRDNDDVEEWRVERGAMPSLLDLTIRGCKKLKEIPDGLRFVTTLRQLVTHEASQELRDRLREWGEDFSKIQHVHSINN
ncbi:probable disease resistance protein At1g58602 isoform X1 [Rhododendron vialii]|uniref:probable disease resistance protein At1g58602 isoform X1 n=1 Tax=Rhododendron vialii TaxID=182163 RepID=UPI00265DE153|nr:probable disease resistance protein At1g58602 isoform X1 [Rhododendron vialii]XP_058190791.1 probable disease resistance protein At1g58602 isoform X1 [Rhododendron vialii]XP_058190792.1 probable disease resistance protein At1g58602 isoform X1 [Rhododendron vialii]XP_058190793.1 probable disease resistance protein At1g58602 isoform X1 [Rhododendron vialii]XP_058190794.1 probable disease resistance protein At1g58602 isoform X1 [Rhododendron vialii]XP_058190795.1 probable disease resistance pr